MYTRPVIFLVVLVAVLVPGAAARAEYLSPPSIAVLELRPTSAEDARLAALLSDALALGVGKAHAGPVVSQREILARIDANAQQQLMGCSDDKCVIDLSRGLAVDQVISGRVGVLNGNVLVFLSLLSLKDGGVLARTSLVVPVNDKQLAAVMEREAGRMLSKEPTSVIAMERAAEQLFSADAEKTADHKFTDLRVAVLFDEIKSDGSAVAGRPVEACVQKQLIDAGADVVSSAVVAHLKGRTGPRVLLQGGVPETLSADEVDVIVAGVVEYETTHNETLGVHSTSAGLTMSLLKIDTGDVVASEAPVGKGTGHGPQDAQRAASADVCQKARAVLQSAVAARVKRGERIVLEASGVANAAAGAALVELLSKQKMVGRAKLKRVQGNRAVIDLIVKGGDGVALALALAAAGPDGPRVLEAGPAAIKVTFEKPPTASKKDRKTDKATSAPAG